MNCLLYVAFRRCISCFWGRYQKILKEVLKTKRPSAANVNSTHFFLCLIIRSSALWRDWSGWSASWSLMIQLPEALSLMLRFLFASPPLQWQKCVAPLQRTKISVMPPHQECAACIIQYWCYFLTVLPHSSSFNLLSQYVCDTSHNPHLKDCKFPLPQNLMCQIVNSPHKYPNPESIPFLEK